MKKSFIFLNKFTYEDRDETTPVAINVNQINFFYEWDDKEKSTFIDLGSTGIVVKESYATVLEVLKL